MQPSEVLGGQKGPCLTITTYARNQKCIACYDRIQHNAFSGAQLMHAIKSNAYFEQTQCILCVRGSQSQVHFTQSKVLCFACNAMHAMIEHCIQMALGLQSQNTQNTKRNAYYDQANCTHGGLLLHNCKSCAGAIKSAMLDRAQCIWDN